MASIYHEITVTCPATQVWDAVRDVGALDTRLVPGFVTRCSVVAGSEPPVRRVTFASGVVLEETIVAVDDAAMRLVWSISAEFVAHHNGALQVTADGDNTRVAWTADVLPHALAGQFGPLMAAGLAAMKGHFEGTTNA